MELLLLAAEIVVLILIAGVLLEEREPESLQMSNPSACWPITADESQHFPPWLLIG